MSTTLATCTDCGDSVCDAHALEAASASANAAWRTAGSPAEGPLCEARDRASEAWSAAYDACLVRAATALRAATPDTDAGRWATHFLFAMERARIGRESAEWYRSQWQQVIGIATGARR